MPCFSLVWKRVFIMSPPYPKEGHIIYRPTCMCVCITYIYFFTHLFIYLLIWLNTHKTQHTLLLIPSLNVKAWSVCAWLHFSSNQFILWQWFFLCNYKKSWWILQATGLFALSTLNVIWTILANKRFATDDPKIRKFLDMLDRLFRSGQPAGDITVILPFMRYVYPPAIMQHYLMHNIQGFMRVSIQCNCIIPTVYNIFLLSGICFSTSYISVFSSSNVWHVRLTLF